MFLNCASLYSGSYNGQIFQHLQPKELRQIRLLVSSTLSQTWSLKFFTACQSHHLFDHEK